VPENGSLSMYAVPAAGGVARRLCSACGRPIEWVDGGARILYDKAAKNKEAGVLDVASGNTTTILRVSDGFLYTPRLSPDHRLFSFTRSGGGLRLYVVPFSGDRLIPEQEWRQLIQGALPGDREPIWSPDGRLLYFLSQRDGFLCVWAVRFDPAAMKAVGEPFPVRHFHTYRYSLLNVNDPADIGLSIAGKKMFLAVREVQSNIWLAERARPQAGR